MRPEPKNLVKLINLRTETFTIKMSPLSPVIHAISVKNFKSLKETGMLRLKPITLLVGPNSSGKTALLQTILVLKQTLESRNIKTPLVLRGKYVDLGSFKETVFGYNSEEDIEISLGIGTTYNLEKALGVKESTYQGYSLVRVKVYYDIKNDRLISKDMELSISDTMNLKINREKLEISQKEQVINYKFRSRREVEKRNFLYIPRTSILDIETLNFMKEQLEDALEKALMKKSLLEREIEKEVEEKKRQAELERLQKEITSLREDLAFLDAKMSEDLDIKQARVVDFSLKALRRSSLRLQKLLVEDTYYVGPLREYPQRYYIASGERPRDVGLRGEHTVEVIYFDFRQKEARYVKLKKWMKEMDLAYDVRLSPVTEGMYTILISDPKLKIGVSLANVGFGVSQLLPILVEGIYARKGSVLLMEQPEIHLHPRLQAALADFFIDMANEGKQVIVETHSEHIILRLQRRIAENKLSNKDIAIYYFEPSEEGTKITPIEISEYGIIEKWPKGFFEEDLEESYSILEALGKRKKNVSGN